MTPVRLEGIVPLTTSRSYKMTPQRRSGTILALACSLLKKGTQPMKYLVAPSRNTWSNRAVRVGLLAGLLAVMLGVGLFSFTPKAHANDVDRIIFVEPHGTLSYPCSPMSHSIAAPQSARNTCDTRVWLFQNRSQTGPSLCLSPNTSTGTFQTHWVFFVITSNSSPCD
jgi:hypothetical protein